MADDRGDAQTGWEAFDALQERRRAQGFDPRWRRLAERCFAPEPCGAGKPCDDPHLQNEVTLQSEEVAALRALYRWATREALPRIDEADRQAARAREAAEIARAGRPRDAAIRMGWIQDGRRGKAADWEAAAFTLQALTTTARPAVRAVWDARAWTEGKPWRVPGCPREAEDALELLAGRMGRETSTVRRRLEELRADVRRRLGELEPAHAYRAAEVGRALEPGPELEKARLLDAALAALPPR